MRELSLLVLLLILISATTVIRAETGEDGYGSSLTYTERYRAMQSQIAQIWWARRLLLGSGHHHGSSSNGGGHHHHHPAAAPVGRRNYSPSSSPSSSKTTSSDRNTFVLDGGGGKNSPKCITVQAAPCNSNSTNSTEIDPRYGVDKRLVPTGPNPLHN